MTGEITEHRRASKARGDGEEHWAAPMPSRFHFIWRLPFVIQETSYTVAVPAEKSTSAWSPHRKSSTSITVVSLTRRPVVVRRADSGVDASRVARQAGSPAVGRCFRRSAAGWDRSCCSAWRPVSTRPRMRWRRTRSCGVGAPCAGRGASLHILVACAHSVARGTDASACVGDARVGAGRGGPPRAGRRARLHILVVDAHGVTRRAGAGAGVVDASSGAGAGCPPGSGGAAGLDVLVASALGVAR